MKYYINLNTKEKTQSSLIAYQWYRNGSNIAVYIDGIWANDWIH